MLEFFPKYGIEIRRLQDEHDDIYYEIKYERIVYGDFTSSEETIKFGFKLLEGKLNGN